MRSTFRTCLLATIVSSVSGASSTFADTIEQYTLTASYYSETADLGAIVVDEFGPGAEVADWEDIKMYFSENIEEFCDHVGLLGTEYPVNGALCCRNGQRWWSGSRHYWLARHDHHVPSGWLVHDHIDNHLLDLGSWYGMSLPVLVRLSECDGDDDGWEAEACGGPDCDDTNPFINPSRCDSAMMPDGIDNDCDSWFDEDECIPCLVESLM